MIPPAFVMQPLPFKEAIEAFQGRLPLRPDQFAALGSEARAKAFTMAGVYREDMLAEVYGALDKALSTGTTFADFKREMLDIWRQRGMVAPDDWRLRTVFQTNLQTSYQAGRYRQMSETVKSRPYWQYQAVMDGRTRPNHAALHGMIWEAIHPVWSRIYPPNGFNCRCAVVSLSRDEMEEEGLNVTERAPAMQLDPGWDYNPGRAHWGEGHINRVLDMAQRSGGWKALDRLLPAMDAPPATMPPPAALPFDLPVGAEELLRKLGGSQEAVRAYYRSAAREALGFAEQDGDLQSLELVDARGDRVLLAPKMLRYATEKAENLGRGRYLVLARDVVENADEIWLMPGQYPDGRVVMRRCYLKAYEDHDMPHSMLALLDFTRLVWEGFSAYPMRTKDINKKRVGLLLYSRMIGRP